MANSQQIGDHLKYDFSLFLDQVVLCLNDTWHRLDESDRTMPGDVPYSNEYILDLYDQIVRFKALCERAKQNLSDRNDAKSKYVFWDTTSLLHLLISSPQNSQPCVERWLGQNRTPG